MIKKFSTRYSTLIKDVRTYLMKGWLQGVREILNWNTFSNKLCDKNKIKQDCQNWRNSVKICVNVHTSCVLLIPFFSVYQPFSFLRNRMIIVFSFLHLAWFILLIVTVLRVTFSFINFQVSCKTFGRKSVLSTK